MNFQWIKQFLTGERPEIVEWGPSYPRGWGQLWDPGVLLLMCTHGPPALKLFSFPYSSSIVMSICYLSLSVPGSLLALPSHFLIKGKSPCWESRGIIREECQVNWKLNNCGNFCPPYLYLWPSCRTETCSRDPSTEFPSAPLKIKAETRSLSRHSRDMSQVTHCLNIPGTHIEMLEFFSPLPKRWISESFESHIDWGPH